ncbi:MAG TPA: hypothetical protein VLE97_07280 [Gaiellaceae bacterium]|nr:hypothetical protein [Gaiellaceae bacterium]
MTKFSVEIMRVQYSCVRVDVEADSYSEAGTRAMELAKKIAPHQFQPSPYRKDELRVTSTDKRKE